MMNKTALITGIGGFLGSHVAHQLIANGLDVVGIGRNINALPEEIRLKSRIYEGEIHSDLLSKILKEHKPGLVVHAAGGASVQASIDNPYADFTSSVDLTAFVLESIRKFVPNTHFVLLSSAAVYGSPAELPISESARPDPISAYGYHRMLTEFLVREASKLHALNATVFRIFSAYGERIKRQVISDLCHKFNRAGSRPVELRGSGQETRDFIHASDVGRAVWHAFEGSVFGTFNLSSGVQTSIRDLADTVASHFGSQSQVRFDLSDPEGVPKKWHADVSRFCETGFNCEITLEQGIKTFCAWFREEHSSEAPERATEIISMSAPAMTFATKPLVGFPSMATWMGGINYLDILTKGLKALPEAQRPAMVLVVQNWDGIELHKSIIERMDQLWIIGKKIGAEKLPVATQLQVSYLDSLEQAVARLDTFFPVISDVVRSEKGVSWIPDFQHLYLPELFSESERSHRDGQYKLIAEQAKHVVFSSKDAHADFLRINPTPNAKCHVLPFYASPEETWYQADPYETCQQYHLPRNFLICCNQFWQHKNHLALFEAIHIMRKHDVHVPLVCTGTLSDHRRPEYIQNLKKSIQDLGIQDLVYLLGEIPRTDQLQLMRASMAVVQPSLFEGWSTVVEDARVLGKTIFLSNLKVHLEQAPKWGRFFNPRDAFDLASVIIDEAARLRPGPDRAREERAKAEATGFAGEFARNFMGLVAEVSGKGMPAKESAAVREHGLDLTIVLATKNRAGLLKEMLASIPEAVRNLSYELIVIDGASNDGTREILNSTANCRLLDEQSELGPGRHAWPVLYNLGYKSARGRWSIFASDDITFEPDCFSKAIINLAEAPANVAGGIFFYKNEIPEDNWRYFGIDFLARNLPLLNYGLLRTDIFRELGGINEEYQFYCADGDLTYKIAERGFVLTPLPFSNVVHHNQLDLQKKANLDGLAIDSARFRERWSKLGEGDTVCPRRMLWDINLAGVFGVALSHEIARETLQDLWRVVACIQHGMFDEARACMAQLQNSNIPREVLDKATHYLNAFEAALLQESRS